MDVATCIAENYHCIDTSSQNMFDVLISKFPKKEIAIIGIEGASGSGKTTFTNQLAAHVGSNKAACISLDDYVHLTKEEMLAQHIETRYDWRSRDKAKFLTDILQLKQGKTITKPIQDYLFDKPFETTEIIEPRPFILVEGNLDITDICDVMIFLYAPDEILIQRRFERDRKKHIHTSDNELLQWIQKSLEYYRLFLEPQAPKAHIIIDTHNNRMYEK